MNSRTQEIQISSYAKVNLTLDVLRVRDDGFHAIESVMQSIDLCDTITLAVADHPGIRMECNMSGVPTDERNLVHKAATALLRAHGMTPRLNIRLHKRVPIQAGLGGGSSNAAHVIIALDRLLDLSTGSEKLREIAAQIGSDVPFFLIGGTAHVSGRGESVKPLPTIAPRSMVIVKPQFGISTAWSYRRIDEMRAESRGKTADGEEETASQQMVKCIESEGCVRLAQLLANDLEGPAVERHPEILEIKRALLQAGATAALMCGSGSAVFGLFPDDKTPDDLGVLRRFGKVFTTRTTKREEIV